MFRALSLKTKIIIFIVFLLIGSGLVIRTAIENRKSEEKLKVQLEQQIKEEEAAKLKRLAEAKQKEEEENKKAEEQRIQEEKKKAQDDKNARAVALFHSKRYNEALELGNELLKEDPQNFVAYNVIGITQCYTGKYDEGMKNIDKSLEIKNDYAYGRFNKALAYELWGHYEEALQWYDKALELEDYVWSYYGIASIYGRRGDVANTCKYLKMAIDKSPGVKDEAQKEADFDRVRNSKEFQDLIRK